MSEAARLPEYIRRKHAGLDLNQLQITGLTQAGAQAEPMFEIRSASPILRKDSKILMIQ